MPLEGENTEQNHGVSSKDSGTKSQEIEEKIVELKRSKRAKKTAATKVRHNVEKLCASKGELNVGEIEKDIAGLWELLEVTLDIMDELSFIYIKADDRESKEAMSKEADAFEAEINECISKAESVIKENLSYESSQSAINTTVELRPSTPSQQSSESNVSTGVESTVRVQSRLKPLKLPVFNGNKVMFEDFWALFESLVDKGTESANVKMARLRQSLTGAALEAIRGLGVSQPEYEEAKELLKTKYGGHRRQLQAYMDQLESMAPLKNSDIRGFERFSDLVRVSVVKLQADGRDGELGEGTLHSLLVKKLTDRQVESYSRWLGENKKVRSVFSLRDWLKEEVRIRVEAAEMVHGVVDSGDSGVKRVEGSRSRGGVKTGDRGSGRLYFSDGVGGRVDDKKPPCALCLGSHGVWTCKKFQGMSVESRWKVAKEKHLCFRCLASDHTGKLCKRSKMCNIDGCKKNHHILLHDMLPRQSDKPNSQGNTSVVAGEGEISQHAHTSVNKEEKTETFS